MQTPNRILLLHHTHTDIGYTHSQPVVWRLHRQIIDRAVELCEATSGNEAPSKMRWTCEVTSTLEDWLAHASSEKIQKFRELVTAGQMGAGAFYFNMTPLIGQEELRRSLRPVKELRDSLGLPFRMAINHDVNGLPWPVVGELLDAGVDTLLMGINPHFGGHPMERPLIFDWEGPDGRTIRTFNAEHYSSFQRWLRPQERSIDVMEEGLKRYLESLARQRPDYPHDFILMSATHFDFVDNNPPDETVIEMVQRWNAEGRTPVIEFVTSDQLAEEMHKLPQDTVPRERGDWPDFWNFGCASSARETRINRETKARLATIAKIGGPIEEDRADYEKAWWNALLFDEHTWGSWATTWNYEADDVAVGLGHKKAFAFDARSLTSWVMRRSLDRLVGNSEGSNELEGIAVSNPASLRRSVMLTLPTRLVTDAWQHYPSRMHNLGVRAACLTDDEEREVGPISIPADGVVIVSVEDLQKQSDLPAECRVEEGLLESPYYTLKFEPSTGKVLSLVDRELDQELLNQDSEWDFFGYVRESVDAQRHQGKEKYHGRDALFDTDFEKLSEKMQSGWQSDWPAMREKAPNSTKAIATRYPLGPQLVLQTGTAPGAEDLVMTITLPADRKAVICEAKFNKTQTLNPEGIYFTFPFVMKDWRARYDSAGSSVELDADQLRGTVRDYQTVESFASIADSSTQVTLACPDAPMVQFGDFNFGKCLESVPREESCLMLAWPMNTYWDTNFPSSQPGFQRFRYELTSSSEFDGEAALAFGHTAATPVEFHPVIKGHSCPNRI